jgi:hypothetical protein
MPHSLNRQIPSLTVPAFFFKKMQNVVFECIRDGLNKRDSVAKSGQEKAAANASSSRDKRQFVHPVLLHACCGAGFRLLCKLLIPPSVAAAPAATKALPFPPVLLQPAVATTTRPVLIFRETKLSDTGKYCGFQKPIANFKTATQNC